MRLKYSTLQPSQSELDSLPWLPLVLLRQGFRIETLGLVDSGALINVLPYDLGLELGFSWDEPRQPIKLAGNIGRFPAKGIIVRAQVGPYAPVELAFAWSASNETRLILGQFNFFLEYNVHFYRSQLAFEINPKTN